MVDIIHRIGIKAPLSKVYDAVATAKGVAGWWTRDTTGSARVGGKVNVRFRHKDGREVGQMDFEMIKLEPTGKFGGALSRDRRNGSGPMRPSSWPRKATRPCCSSGTATGGKRSSSRRTAVPSGRYFF